VLLVLAGHFGLLPESAATVGVSLFFTLSGFLITALLLGEWAQTGEIRIRSFYMRRARRLLPALVLLLVATAIAAAVRGDIATWLPGSIPVLLYVGNWGYLAGVVPLDLGHTWSLAIEEQFYLLWPAALLVLLPRGGRTLPLAIVSLIVLSVLSTLSDFPSMGLAYYGSPQRAKELLAGGLIAALSFHRGRDVVPWTPIAVFAGVVLAFSCLTPWMMELGPLAFVLPTAIIVAWVAGHPRLFAWAPLTGTGRISYGLYLYHYPLVGLAPAFVLVPITFALAMASWILVERRFTRRRSQPTLDPGSASVLGPLPEPPTLRRRAHLGTSAVAAEGELAIRPI